MAKCFKQRKRWVPGAPLHIYYINIMIQRNKREAEAGVTSGQVSPLLCVALLGTCLAQAWCGGWTLERMPEQWCLKTWLCSEHLRSLTHWAPQGGRQAVAPSQRASSHSRKSIADVKSVFHWASRNDGGAGTSTQIGSDQMGGGNVEPFLVWAFLMGKDCSGRQDASCGI